MHMRGKQKQNIASKDIALPDSERIIFSQNEYGMIVNCFKLSYKMENSHVKLCLFAKYL